MNLLPILLGFMLFSGFNKKNKDAQFGGLNLGDLSGILSNPDLIGLLPHITKLFDKNACEEDKNAAMMALMTNPAMFEIIQKFTAKGDRPQDTAQDFGNFGDKAQEQPTDGKDGYSAESKEFYSCNRANNEKDAKHTVYNDGYSAESKEFFKPVENVAGIEISQKLYKLYDNWYIKK